jgi:hypothetical protein
MFILTSENFLREQESLRNQEVRQQKMDESESLTGAIPVGDAYMRSLCIKPTGTPKEINSRKVFCLDEILKL